MSETLGEQIESTDGKDRDEPGVVLRWVAIIVASVVLFSALVLALWFLG